MLRLQIFGQESAVNRVEISKPDEFALEEQVDFSGWAVPLFADDEFRLVVDAAHVVLPFLMGVVEFLFVFEGDDFRFLLLHVVFIAVDEHHHIRILFDGSGFTQVR